MKLYHFKAISIPAIRKYIWKLWIGKNKIFSQNWYLIIMYHEVGIAKLSPTQLSRLRNGHKVRVKMGEAHKN